MDLATIRTILEYGDWSNQRLLDCALTVGDEDLDKDMHIGPGSLRRTLMHIYTGEFVWLRRWRGEVETRWAGETDVVPVAELTERFEANARERDAFLNLLSNEDLDRVQLYRDSKGTLFEATLGDMLMQGALHSKHHHAQAVNILRRLGARWPELDYMMRVRRPV